MSGNRSVTVILCLLMNAVAARAQQTGESELLVGTAWYPEQWREQRSDADLALSADSWVDLQHNLTDLLTGKAGKLAALPGRRIAVYSLGIAR